MIREFEDEGKRKFSPSVRVNLELREQGQICIENKGVTARPSSRYDFPSLPLRKITRSDGQEKKCSVFGDQYSEVGSVQFFFSSPSVRVNLELREQGQICIENKGVTAQPSSRYNFPSLALRKITRSDGQEKKCSVFGDQ